MDQEIINSQDNLPPPLATAMPTGQPDPGYQQLQLILPSWTAVSALQIKLSRVYIHAYTKMNVQVPCTECQNSGIKHMNKLLYTLSPL